jgi:hypothetical protein
MVVIGENGVVCLLAQLFKDKPRIRTPPQTAKPQKTTTQFMRFFMDNHTFINNMTLDIHILLPILGPTIQWRNKNI